MFSKLAFRNVSKSIKDYAVYFLTLMLGVCVFYVFNAMDAQQSMMDITQSGIDSMAALVQIINVVSVFVSVVLAFLILYANKFMIRRRKKELGIYMTLGMQQQKLSGMLVLETLVIGVLALAAGILLGLLLSQGLAVVTASMFDVRIVDFHFIFSIDAFFKTIVYFGIIFVVVMAFNYITISRLKLIDLLYADRKNEEYHIRKTPVSILLMVLGAILVGISYYMVIKAGAGMILYAFAPAMLCNVAGTLLVFASLSGFMIKGMQARKKSYYKGLNMFVTRQLASKVNTNFVTMTFICTMIFLTIVILSTVASFNNVFNTENNKIMPFDMSMTIYASESGQDATVRESLPKVGIDEKELFSDSHEYELYATDVLANDVAPLFTEFLTEEAAQQNVETMTLDVVKKSDYNRLLEMAGRQPIKLAENEFAFMSVTDRSYAGIQQAIDAGKSVTINGRTLTAAKLPIQDLGLWTSSGGYTGDFVAIVPDAAADGLAPKIGVYVANYAGGAENITAVEKKLEDSIADIDSFRENSGINLRMSTKISVNAASNGLTTSMIFVGIYMGLIFLIAGAAVLALQQLSDATDSKKRYELLKKLGTDSGMINAALKKQVGIYFLLPLAIAAVHSAVGMWVMNQGIIGVFNTDVLVNSMIAALFIALVYGGYFLATYFGCKNIVHARYERQQ